MRTLMFLLVFISPPFFKRWLLRWGCGATLGRGVKIGWFSTVSGKSVTFGDYSELRALSVIRCAGDVEIGDYAAISSMVLIYGLGDFRTGRHSYIGPQCLINADEEVRIGDLSALGPRCMVFTHGSFLPYTEGYWVKMDGVSLGDRVWVAAGVFIHPGVRVGDNVFVNSRSVLAWSIEGGQVVEGNPAQPVTEMARVQRRMTPKRVDDAARQVLERFSEMVLVGSLGVEMRESDRDAKAFRFAGREYRIVVVPAKGTVPTLPEPGDRTTTVVLSNQPEWRPPAALKRPVVFDLTTMKTQPLSDPIHRHLWQFMRMYFGLAFEFEERSELSSVAKTS